MPKRKFNCARSRGRVSCLGKLSSQSSAEELARQRQRRQRRRLIQQLACSAQVDSPSASGLKNSNAVTSDSLETMEASEPVLALHSEFESSGILIPQTKDQSEQDSSSSESDSWTSAALCVAAISAEVGVDRQSVNDVSTSESHESQVNDSVNSDVSRSKPVPDSAAVMKDNKPEAADSSTPTKEQHLLEHPSQGSPNDAKVNKTHSIVKLEAASSLLSETVNLDDNDKMAYGSARIVMPQTGYTGRPSDKTFAMSVSCCPDKVTLIDKEVKQRVQENKKAPLKNERLTKTERKLSQSERKSDDKDTSSLTKNKVKVPIKNVRKLEKLPGPGTDRASSELHPFNKKLPGKKPIKSSRKPESDGSATLSGKHVVCKNSKKPPGSGTGMKAAPQQNKKRNKALRETENSLSQQRPLKSARKLPSAVAIDPRDTSANKSTARVRIFSQDEKEKSRRQHSTRWATQHELMATAAEAAAWGKSDPMPELWELPDSAAVGADDPDQYRRSSRISPLLKNRYLPMGMARYQQLRKLRRSKNFGSEPKEAKSYQVFLALTCPEVNRMFTYHAPTIWKIARLTDCRVRLMRAILNRRTNGSGTWARFAQIEIEGTRPCSAMVCDRILREKFPCYSERRIKRLDNRASVSTTLSISLAAAATPAEPLTFARQRFGQWNRKRSRAFQQASLSDDVDAVVEETTAESDQLNQ